MKFYFVRPLNWQFKPAPNESDGLKKIRIDRDDNKVWYVGSRNGLYITRDEGNSWERYFSGPTVALSLDPKNTNRIYTGSNNKLYRSDDKGRAWCLLKAFPSNEFIQSILVSPIDNAIFVGMHWGNSQNANGLYKSINQGAAWNLYPFNIPPRPQNQDKGLIIWGIAEDPKNGFVYLGTEPTQKPSSGMPFSYDPPTLRSKNRGLTWEDVAGTKGSPGSLGWHAVRIQVHPTTQAVYALLEAGAVMMSTNFGDSWNLLSRVGGSMGGWDLLMDEEDPTTFFAGGIDGTIGLSIDGAQSYTQIGPMGLQSPVEIILALNPDRSKLYAVTAQALPPGVYVGDLNLSPSVQSTAYRPAQAVSVPIEYPSCFGPPAKLNWTVILVTSVVIVGLIAALLARWFKPWPPQPKPQDC